MLILINLILPGDILWVNKDKQIIKDSSGDKIGEIKTNFWGDRVIEDDKGDKIGTVRKNIWGETEIKKD